MKSSDGVMAASANLFTRGFHLELPEELLPTFRRYFAVHIFLQTIKLHWRYDDPWIVYGVPVLILIGAALAWHPRVFRFGLVILLAYKSFYVIHNFPNTGNHPYVEALILLVLLLFSRQGTRPEEVQAEAYACHLIQVTVLSIYLFSGLQKLVHGMWLNGEYLAESLFFRERFGVWYNVQLLVDAMGSIFGERVGQLPLVRSLEADPSPLLLPGWAVVFFIAMGWFVVASEVGAPLLIMNRATRSFGVIAMLIVQCLVGLFSWETEFMFAAVGAMLLWFRHRIVYNYMLLLAIHILWSLGVVIADVRVWVL